MDLKTGESTVVQGIGDGIALTFEPASQHLYGTSYNSDDSSPPRAFWEYEFSDPPKNNAQFRWMPTVGTAPQASLAFLPHVEQE
jgi:hypothetical protein